MLQSALLATAALLAPLAHEDHAFDLMVGDPAPALAVEWVKGEPIEALRDDTTYVVEFWATWCGPCIKAMPHLSKLQAEYAERKVRFVGVNIWEEDQKKVRPFVEKMGDKMAYTVAMDIVPEVGPGERPEGKMAASWMEAAGREGIPSSFIVHKGKVQWIGHPNDMDGPLATIVAGKWDLAAAAKKHRDEVSGKAALKKLELAMRASNWAEAVELIEEALKGNPHMEISLGAQKLFALARHGSKDKAVAYAEALEQGVYRQHPQGLNFIAMVLTDPENEKLGFDPAIAVRVAKKATELTREKEPTVLSTYATALSRAGEHDKAIEAQEKAHQLSIGTRTEAAHRQRLEELRALQRS